jgi:hypothetical protein
MIAGEVNADNLLETALYPTFHHCGMKEQRWLRMPVRGCRVCWDFWTTVL